MSSIAKEGSREGLLGVHTSTAPLFLKRQPTHMLSRTSCRRSFEGQWTIFSYLWFGASSSTRKNLRSYRQSYKPVRARRKNRNDPNSRDRIRFSVECVPSDRTLCHRDGDFLASRRESESKVSICFLSRSVSLLSGGSCDQHHLAIATNY